MVGHNYCITGFSWIIRLIQSCVTYYITGSILMKAASPTVCHISKGTPTTRTIRKHRFDRLQRKQHGDTISNVIFMRFSRAYYDSQRDTSKMITDVRTKKEATSMSRRSKILKAMYLFRKVLTSNHCLLERWALRTIPS